MGFRRHAALQVLEAWRVPAGDSERALVKAAHRVAFDYAPRHGYLYVRSRMISSRCNDNHDAFPADEIEKSYRTFLGKPVFVNHHNANHRRARGVIVAVALHRDRNPDGTPDTWVEGLMEVDALKFPRLAKAVITRRIDKTSMGVDVEWSRCSACGNRAESPADYCRHLPAMKGKKFRQRGPDGKVREEIIHEICHGLSFFENSLLVEDPADPTASAWGVDTRGMTKAAGRTAAHSSFDQLKPHEQQAVSLYHQQMTEDGQAPSSGTPHDYSYESRQEPKGDFLKRYMDADDEFKEQYGPDDWEAHHQETLATHPVPHYPGENRWPLIVNDENPNYVDDGYHRMHSYMRDDATHIPTIRMHRSAHAFEPFLAADLRKEHDVKVDAGNRGGPYPGRFRFQASRPAPLSLLAFFRQAITGEEAEPGKEIFAAPNGRSPVRDHFEQKLDEHLDPRHGEDPKSRPFEHPYISAPDHGPYHVTRDPEDHDMRSGTYHLLDREGRDASSRGGGYKGSWFPGYGSAMKDWYRLTHHEDPDNPADGGRKRDILDMSEDHDSRPGPSFPHSRINPGDVAALQRPDARVHKPEGYSPDDEYHGSYEVVKHPETGKFHVVDNAGRSAGYGSGFDRQLQAEHSRDYVEKRQQSKEKAHGIADSMMEGIHQIFDPGSTVESRESTRNLQNGQELMSRYAGGKGRVKFDPDDEGGEPYYERHHYLPNGHESGWYVKHYGGSRADVYHQGTPDEAHDLIDFPEHPEDKNSMSPRIHPDFDDISLGKALHAWHDNDDEGAETRKYYESRNGGEPRIHRWKQRYPNGKPPSREASRRHGLARDLGQSPMKRMASSPYENPGDHPFFQANPVSSGNVTAAYHDSTDDEKALGSRWYADAHHVARSIAGGDAAKGAGLLAAYSPRTPWPVNLMNASRAAVTGVAPGPGTGAMGVHQKLAVKVLSGQPNDEAFRSPKTRAFAHLVEHGGDTDEDVRDGTQRVVIDRHALSAAAGRRMTEADMDQAPVDVIRYHEYVGDQYRQAAADLAHALGHDVAPHQVQAVTWLRQQRLNQAADAAAGGAGKARNQRVRNAWGRWDEHAQQHHPDIAGQGQHMHAGLRTTAYGETTVPPQIDTLRQEACPVCGESNVWTGQRCPVCGFVAPPDLFRDPDLDKARQMRDQMTTEDMGGMPQGPADEEAMSQAAGTGKDADAQMFHPDQITPNGVPVASGDASPGGEGDLPPGPDEEELPPGEEIPPGGEGEPGEEIPPGEEEEEGAPGEEDEDLPPDEQGAVILGCPACGTEFEPGQDGAAGGRPCPACGQAPLAPVDPADDPEKVQKPQGGQVMGVSTAAREAFRAQQQVIAVLRAENAALAGQMRFLAELAGVSGEMNAIRAEAMRRAGDLNNPGQPVPDPPEGPPTETTEETLQAGAQGDASRPGTEPGSTQGVPAAATTTAITPGVEIQTPPAANLIDVTAPVQGTNPSEDGGVPLSQLRIETDVRVDPDPLKAQGPGIGGAGDNGTAFPWMMDAALPGGGNGEAKAASRVMASVRLARLRVTAGLERGDELDVASRIEADASLTPGLIDHEIALLTRMGRTAAARRPQQRTATRSGPSLAAPPAPPMVMVGAAPAPQDWDDDGSIFD